jgi:hypothetical protein
VSHRDRAIPVGDALVCPSCNDSGGNGPLRIQAIAIAVCVNVGGLGLLPPLERLDA